MLGIINTQPDLTQMIGSASIEEEKEVTYTGIDNLLFAKAYTHMTRILQKILLAPVPNIHINPEASSITAIRQLFCTKKPYFMAMIAFLSTCHQVAATEEQKLTVKDDLAENLATTHLGTYGTASIASSSSQQSNPGISNFEEEKTTKIEDLLKLIGIDNETELLNLSDSVFNERVKKIPSLKIRGKIRDFRIDLQSIIEEQKEQEEAEARAKQREEDLDRFYREAVITDVKEDSQGNIIWAKVSCSNEVAALLEGSKKLEGNKE